MSGLAASGWRLPLTRERNACSEKQILLGPHESGTEPTGLHCLAPYQAVSAFVDKIGVASKLLLLSDKQVQFGFSWRQEAARRL